MTEIASDLSERLRAAVHKPEGNLSWAQIAQIEAGTLYEAAAELERLTAENARMRADVFEEAAKIAEGHAYCGCNGEHGTCLADDPPKAIAADIRSRAALQESADYCGIVQLD